MKMSRTPRFLSSVNTCSQNLIKGAILDISYSRPSFLRRYKRWFREPRVPIARRSAIRPTVIVVSARKRAAKSTFTESPLGPSFQISFLPPPPLQLLRDDYFRQRLRRLRALLTVMLPPSARSSASATPPETSPRPDTNRAESA